MFGGGRDEDISHGEHYFSQQQISKRDKPRNSGVSVLPKYTEETTVKQKV